MILLVGLGNPGTRYARHRHNIGFMAADAIAHAHRFSAFRARYQALVAEGTLGGEKVLIQKPQTYMNESGRAVGAAMRYLRLTPQEVIVFYDELDLALGKVRVKQGGGTAGHNGIRSIAAHVGPDFWRVRLGIGHPGDKERVLGHVLSDFAASERALVASMLEAVAEAAPFLAQLDMGRFMNRVSVLMRGTEEPAASPPPPPPSREA